MSSSLLPNTAIPKPLPDDDDDVSWALQTAAVQWGRGAYQDAIVWLRRAAESAIELSAWSRAADLNATASRLEKQLSKQPTPSVVPMASGLPSAPPRAAILPSFPVPNTAVPPAVAGPAAGARRQTTGYSSFPPLSERASQRPSNAGRSSVVIDVEEGELELSEDEIRELESAEAPSTDIPNGARPSRPNWQSPGSNRSSAPGEPRASLPAFTLESSPPSREPSLRSAPTSSLPAFPLQASSRPPPSGPAAATRGAGSTAPVLPSFPLDPGASSLPPVSKWPRLGSPGTSHLPPNPGLPNFETVPPSRPFVDDGDDGAPGLGDLALVEEPVPALEPLESLEPLEQLEPITSPPVSGRTQYGGLSLNLPTASTKPPPLPPQDDRLELHELEGARSSPKLPVAPKPLVQLPIRPGRASGRPKASAAPLPPALPQRRSERSAAASPASASTSRRPATPASALRESGQPRMPSASPIEPRMPERTLSYNSPLDLASRADRAESVTPSERRSSSPSRSELQEPRSVAPPPSARSVEPEDLPTVTSPSLSRPPPPTEVELPKPEGPSDTERPATAPEVRGAGGSALATPLPDRRVPQGAGERRRINFKFEEPKSPTRPPSFAPNLGDLLRAEESEFRSPPPPQFSSGGQPGLIATAHDRGGAVPQDLGRGVHADPIAEESLANLPPVVSRPVAESRAPGSDDVMISGVRLAEVRGFSDLPASAHRLLANTARIEALASGEEASFFSVALVLEGWVGLMPAIADTACATAVVGEVVFTEGTLADGLMLRVVAGQDDVVVATWDSEAIKEATRDCPWVADDLRLLADGFQALAGACLGPLGDRLDDSLRSIVTSRCEIRTLLPGEQLCAAKKTVPGMHIIGGGEIELVDENGRVTKTYGTGEFLFAPQVLAGGVAPYSARAGSKGSLVLFAPRMAAHELLVSVPPLLEILAE